MSDLIKPTRRGFLAGVAGLIVAPAIVRVSSLMPVHSFEPLWEGPWFEYNIGLDAIVRAWRRRALINGEHQIQWKTEMVSALEFMQAPDGQKPEFMKTPYFLENHKPL